ncbi:hypothetical protein E1284_00025 [Actinomadura bangladeshensis]|uniref:Uncharacterized protein n=1 Tax=Actinomadura bangladeshensis TaxID=453573 RepID=A0A4R4PER1_9ACTN|nr:hypothetical protein E1284_00025 [Actinomadura bangladeshensis]
MAPVPRRRGRTHRVGDGPGRAAGHDRRPLDHRRGRLGPRAASHRRPGPGDRSGPAPPPRPHGRGRLRPCGAALAPGRAARDASGLGAGGSGQGVRRGRLRTAGGDPGLLRHFHRPSLNRRSHDGASPDRSAARFSTLRPGSGVRACGPVAGCAHAAR